MKSLVNIVLFCLTFCRIDAMQVSLISGLNFNSFDYNSMAELSSTNFLVGVRYKNWTETNWSILVTFDQKGFEISEPHLISNLSVNYISISPQFRLIRSEQFTFFIGPQLSFLLSAKINEESNGKMSSGDITEGFSESRLAGIVGAMYTISRFSLSVSYDYGFTSAFKYESDNHTAEFKSVQLYVLYDLFE